MTPGKRRTRKQAELDRYGEVTFRARAALPVLPTEALYRIHALLERALASDEPDLEVMAELDRTLDIYAG